MPTLDQISKIHDEFGHASTLGSYLSELRSVGVVSYATYVYDGHSEYYCLDGKILTSDAVHELFTVSDKVDKARFLSTLDLSHSGKMGYVEMSKRLAVSGVNQWVFDAEQMTISYLDKAGNVIQREPVRNADNAH